MSFKCDLCSKKQEQSPTEPRGNIPVRVVVEWNENFEHPYRKAANYVRGPDGWEFKHDPGGFGKQIKKEINACRTCAKWLDRQEAIAAVNNTINRVQRAMRTVRVD